MKLVDMLYNEDKTNALIYKGLILNKIKRYKEVLKLNNQFKSMMQNDAKKLVGYTIISNALLKLGETQKAVKLISKGEIILKSLEKPKSNLSKEWEGRFLLVKGNLFLTRGELDFVQENFSASLKIQKKLNNKTEITEILSDIGSYYLEKKQYDLSSKYIQRSLKLSEDLNDNYGMTTSLFNLGLINIEMKDLKSAQNYFNICLKKSREFNFMLGNANSIFGKARVYQYSNELKKALKYYNEALKLYQGIGITSQVATILNLLGQLTYQSTGELNNSLTYFMKSLKLFNKIANPLRIARIQMNIGVIYERKGDLNNAIRRYNMSLKLAYEQDNVFLKAELLNNLGVIYDHKGELDIALSYFSKSLKIDKESKGIISMPNRLCNLASVYSQMGQNDIALKYYNNGIQISKKIGNPLYLSMIIFSIILNLDDYLRKTEPTELKNYFKELENLAKNNDSKIINLQNQLAKAIIFKKSSRLKEKAKAQTILEQIIQDEIIDHSYTVIALKLYCELLLLEFKTSEDETILEELLSILGKLQSIANSQNSFTLLIEVLILESKVSLLKSDIEKASSLLDQALNVAQTHELTKLQEIVMDEKNTFEKELQNWKKLISKGASIYQRIEATNINNYIKEIRERFFSEKEY